MAYAPGAIEAMTIIAFALHLDPVFVGVHHLARFTFMSLVLPAAVGVDPRVRGDGRRSRRRMSYSAAIARLPNGNSSRCHTSTSASASASISASS